MGREPKTTISRAAAVHDTLVGRTGCARSRATRGLSRLVGVALLVPLAALSALASSDAPVLEVKQMTFVASRGDSEEMVLHAQKALYRTADETAHLTGVRARIDPEQDKGGFKMRCDEGDLDLKSNDFRAEGNVVGQTDSGQEFRTQWVAYDHENGLLFTDAPVIVTESAGTYQGGGFRYEVEERRFRLLGGASVVHQP